MPTFDYTAISNSGTTVKGRIDAQDRKGALQWLDGQGLYPSSLEASSGTVNPQTNHKAEPVSIDTPPPFQFFGGGVKRKEVTAFTREMAALLEAAIPIPKALQSLGEKEHNPRLKAVVLTLADDVKKGASLSDAMATHERVFSPLYTSMVRVGEEAGALPRVMADLADLLEHEDEIRGEVIVAVSYPAFVLGFGFLTVIVLMLVVLPRLFTMLEEMLDVLPLPTLVLLNVSGFLQAYWFWLLLALGLGAFGLVHYCRKPEVKDQLDWLKLHVPVVGPVFLSSALCRFSGTLGVLIKSGVSLLPALEIVQHTVGNRILARMIGDVSEETRGGHSLAAPMRRLGLFPATAVQMIEVGEETGCLDDMLLKIAKIEERHMRNKTKTLISLLAPALILVVGLIIGYMVIALLLPIFKMSQTLS